LNFEQEHEENPGIDANVRVSDGSQGIDVHAIDGADFRIFRRERLQIPGWGA
jgi:hypothetical protein